MDNESRNTIKDSISELVDQFIKDRELPSEKKEAGDRISLLTESLGKDIDIFYKKYIKTKEKEKEKELYFVHYTDVKTIYKILKNDKNGESNGLRLSDASYSNDPSEGNYLRDILSRTYPWLKNAEQKTSAFVCSFVSGKNKDVRDKITYWQAYGKDGLGCSILLPCNSYNGVFDRVLYGESEAKKLEEEFKGYFDFVGKLYKQFPNRYRRRFVREFWGAFDKIKFLYKDKGYEHEKEYRLIKISEESKERFTNEHPYLKRYIFDAQLEAKKVLGSGSRVTIGPRVMNKDRLCQYLKKLAKEREIYGPQFTFSKIPYRKIR